MRRKGRDKCYALTDVKMHPHGLNCRVRHETGCVPASIIAGNSIFNMQHRNNKKEPLSYDRDSLLNVIPATTYSGWEN